MSFQSLNPELTAKVIYLANLQRNLMQNQNQNAMNEKTVEGNSVTPTVIGQQQFMHPLLMPSLNVSSQKISAMLAALTPPTAVTNTIPIQQAPSFSNSNNNLINARTINSSGNIRSNGSSFGWGNRERKMEENWRMQNRNFLQK